MQVSKYKLIEQLNKNYYQWKAEYDRILKVAPEFGQITLNKYIEFCSLLCSRNFFCYNASEDRFVVPLAGMFLLMIDMFNYSIDNHNQTYWHYISMEKSFIVVAKENIKKGEEIFVDYGTKCSSRFLQYYGFIPENNKYEYVPIALKLDKDDSLLKDKQKILGIDTIEIRELRFSLCKDWPHHKNDKVISYLRLIEYKGDPKNLNTVY